ncbi:MAG TPA: hypothetical protein VKU60_15840, partial [Chloroflexota bacterium]|nr:hypothetical protein [Chloroflexota bacterium]
GSVFSARQDRVVVATGSLLRDRPDTVKAFIKAYLRASQLIAEASDDGDLRAILEQAGYLTTEQERENWAELLAQVRRRMTDGSLPLEGLEVILTEQQQAGNVSAGLTLDRVVRLDPLHEAQRELGLIGAVVP